MVVYLKLTFFIVVLNHKLSGFQPMPTFPFQTLAKVPITRIDTLSLKTFWFALETLS